MPLWVNILTQLLSVGLGVVVPAFIHSGPALATAGKWAAIAAALVGTISHFFNTDGTPQSVALTPPSSIKP
jgi:hypothetical protein